MTLKGQNQLRPIICVSGGGRPVGGEVIKSLERNTDNGSHSICHSCISVALFAR